MAHNDMRPAHGGEAFGPPRHPGGVAGLVDLHAHTYVSDGTLSPTALVELAARKGLAALAVTDHDHLGGLVEARAAGERLGVEVVAGVELSITHPAGELHLLGYFVDPEEPRLAQTLQHLRAARGRRAEAMVERLRALGLDIAMDDVVAAAQGRAEALGRPHVARALMAKGHVASIQEAFDRWLADGRPAHVPKRKLTAAEGIALVHGAGGVAVLAHAVTLPEASREPIVRELAALGMDGIEVAHSKHAPEDRARLAAWADALGLLQSGGSDFHGDNKPDVELGSGKGGNVRVAPEWLEALRTRAARRRAEARSPT